WTSLPIGVVSLAERHGGREVGRENYEAMVSDVMRALTDFEGAHRFRNRIAGKRAHFLGTSGTVTTISGIHLKLPVYERARVDGCWLTARDVRVVSNDLIGMSYAERVAQPCIGQERADLVLAGCAILEALLRTWPCQRLRVAARGLRDGILAPLMAEDGHERRSLPRHQGDGQLPAHAASDRRPPPAYEACAGSSTTPNGRALADRLEPASFGNIEKTNNELAAITATIRKARGKSPATTVLSMRPMRSTSTTSAPTATPADSDSCCATLAKLVARLIAFTSISA